MGEFVFIHLPRITVSGRSCRTLMHSAQSEHGGGKHYWASHGKVTVQPASQSEHTSGVYIPSLGPLLSNLSQYSRNRCHSILSQSKSRIPTRDKDSKSEQANKCRFWSFDPWCCAAAVSFRDCYTRISAEVTVILARACGLEGLWRPCPSRRIVLLIRIDKEIRVYCSTDW